MTISIKHPLKGRTSTETVESIVKVMQSAPELGFVLRASVVSWMEENTRRGTLWYAEVDEQVVGVATIKTRRPYFHLYDTGDVTVLKPYRRQRIGTALYTATTFQGILEGRREVQETVIDSLSGFMVYPSCNGDGGVGFLNSLKYKHYGTLPKRTSGFRDIVLRCHATDEIDDYLTRLAPGTTIELRETNDVRVNFARNMENYEQHDPALAQRIRDIRQKLLDGAYPATVEVVP